MACTLELTGDPAPTTPQPGEAPRHRWVNAYEVTRAYGGPEEGGWYYDVGEPLASIPVKWDFEEAQAKVTILTTFRADYADRRTRYSVIGEEDLEIRVQNHPARPYPQETPHYE
jgi:hypothetical protein